MTKEERLKAAEAYAEGKSSSEVFRRAHIDDFLAGAEAEAESKWVSVNDRLPENGEWVLAYDKELGRHISWFDDKGFVQRNRSKLRNVTHWMELPSPPLNQR